MVADLQGAVAAAQNRSAQLSEARGGRGCRLGSPYLLA